MLTNSSLQVLSRFAVSLPNQLDEKRAPDGTEILKQIQKNSEKDLRAWCITNWGQKEGEKIFQIHLGEERPIIRALPLETKKMPKRPVTEIFKKAISPREEKPAPSEQNPLKVNFDLPLTNLEKNVYYVKECFDIKFENDQYFAEFLGMIDLTPNVLLNEAWISKHRVKWEKRAKDGDVTKQKKYGMDLHLLRAKKSVSKQEEKIEGLLDESPVFSSLRKSGSTAMASDGLDVSQQDYSTDASSLASLDLFVSQRQSARLLQALDSLQKQPHAAAQSDENIPSPQGKERDIQVDREAEREDVELQKASPKKDREVTPLKIQEIKPKEAVLVTPIKSDDANSSHPSTLLKIWHAIQTIFAFFISLPWMFLQNHHRATENTEKI